MKLSRKSGTLSLMVFAAITSPIAMAQDSNWYIGANVGQARAKIDDPRITSGLLAGGFTTTSIANDERDTGYKLFTGYQFNKYFALEGGYFDLGKFGFTATTIPAGTLRGDIKLRGLNLDLVGTMPITDKLSAFGRVGGNYAEAKDTFRGTGFVIVRNPSPSTRASNVKYGAGLQYAFNDAWTLRLEAERYRINDAVGNKGDVDLYSAGLVYRFGSVKPTRTSYAERAPEPVAVTPEPVRPVTEIAPVAPAAPPVQPRFEKYTLSATELFAFDSATLRLPHPKLDEIATALNRNREINNVVITGYADRIGSKQYNQRLSERRANSVKSYLESKGVDSSRMSAAGKGESNPVVVCTDKARPALIKCLEPNRRVEVEQITIETRVR